MMVATTEQLAYDVAGDGPPIVFIHGLTFSRRTWQPIVDRLSGRFTCVTVDLPGHGESTGSAADLGQVLDRLSATIGPLLSGPPVVVGHSAGAVHATAYATAAPVRGVVNVDQTMLVGGFAGMLQQLSPALRGPHFVDAFEPFEASIGVAGLPEPERSRVQATRRLDQEVVLDHWRLPLTTPPVEFQRQVDDLLGQVTAPYLWLTATEFEPDRRYLLEHVPQATVEVWPQGGHVLHLAEPDRFAARVAEFSVTAGASAGVSAGVSVGAAVAGATASSN